MRIKDIVIIGLLSLTPALMAAQTVRIEAEDAKLEGPDLHTVIPTAQPALEAKSSGYSGKGYVTGFNDSSDRIVFTFNALKGGRQQREDRLPQQGASRI